MSQMIGRCDRCRQRKPLFAVDPGELRQEYVCEWCCKYSLLPPQPQPSERVEDAGEGVAEGERCHRCSHQLSEHKDGFCSKCECGGYFEDFTPPPAESPPPPPREPEHR